MNWQISLIVTGLGLQLLGMILQPTFARSPISNSPQIASELTKQNAKFRPPEGIGKPPTSGAGTRSGSCSQDASIPDPPLTVLIPRVDSTEGDFGLTVSEYPDFFVYVPVTEARTVTFVVRDENWNDIYRRQIPISGEAGIVKVSLPKTGEALAVNRNYRWDFAVLCSPENDRGTSNEIAVAGWIRRIALDATVAAQLREATRGEIPSIYAENGIWHEALSSLTALIQENPGNADLLQQWKTLLESAGLAEITRLPVTVE